MDLPCLLLPACVSTHVWNKCWQFWTVLSKLNAEFKHLCAISQPHCTLQKTLPLTHGANKQCKTGKPFGCPRIPWPGEHGRVFWPYKEDVSGDQKGAFPGKYFWGLTQAYVLKRQEPCHKQGAMPCTSPLSEHAVVIRVFTLTFYWYITIVCFNCSHLFWLICLFNLFCLDNWHFQQVDLHSPVTQSKSHRNLEDGLSLKGF